MAVLPNEVKIQLKQWDIEKLDLSRGVVLCGETGCGKTTLAKRLLYTHRKVPRWYLFSDSERANGDFRDIIPEAYKSFTFDQKRLMDIMDSRAKRKQYHRQIGDDNYDPKCGIVIEDGGYNKKAMHSDALRRLNQMGRQLDIFWILSLQFIMNFPIDCRSQPGYICVFRTQSDDVKRRLYKNWFSSFFPTYDMFNQVFIAATREKGQCLVANMVSNTVEYFHADPVTEPFTVGSPEYRAYGEKKFRPIERAGLFTAPDNAVWNKKSTVFLEFD